MKLELRRIVLFTSNMEAMTAFYRDVLGLKVIGAEKGWIDFDAGACRIALHAGSANGRQNCSSMRRTFPPRGRC